MEEYIQPIMEYLRDHALLGLLFAFVIAFIESLPLLGTLFPGSVTMTAIGVLIGAAVLPAIPTFFAAIFGAFLGDCLGFWLGYHYYAEIRRIWPFYKMGKWFNYGENFFAKHGASSIIIGRFIGPTRAAMPLIAGLFRFTWKQFLPSVIVAALLWSLIYMLPGIVLGTLALEFPPEQLTKVFLSGLIFIVFVWFIFWIIQLFFKQLKRTFNRWIQRLWEWMHTHQSTVLFIRLIRNRQNPGDYKQLTLTLLFLLSGFLLLLFLLAVDNHWLLRDINNPLFYFTQTTRNHWRDQVWLFLTMLGTPECLLIISILLAMGLAWKKQWRAATHLALLGLITAAAVTVLKSLTFSPRPEGFIWVDPSSSFPSGHVTMSVAILGFLTFLTLKTIRKQFFRKFVTFWVIVIIFLISLSRILLGQHWLSDILAAWCLGSCTLLLIMISYRRMPKSKSAFNLSKKTWLILLAICFVLPASINIYLNFQNTERDITPAWPKIRMSFQEWWQHPTQKTPLYRSDRLGHIAQPFNVQWAGNLKDIQNFLMSHGWQPLEKKSIAAATIERFNSADPEDNMPLLQWLYQNKPPAIFMIKHQNNSPDILELRLWNSGVQFNDSSLPLWIGIVTYHTPPEKLLRFPRQYIHVQSGHILLNMSSQFRSFQAKLVVVPISSQPKRIRNLHWDGQIFILLLPPAQ